MRPLLRVKTYQVEQRKELMLRLSRTWYYQGMLEIVSIRKGEYGQFYIIKVLYIKGCLSSVGSVEGGGWVPEVLNFTHKGERGVVQYKLTRP